jgi:hypothetical protein
MTGKIGGIFLLSFENVSNQFSDICPIDKKLKEKLIHSKKCLKFTPNKKMP